SNLRSPRVLRRGCRAPRRATPPPPPRSAARRVSPASGKYRTLSCRKATSRAHGEETHACGLFKPCHDCYISRRGVIPRFPFSDGFDAGWSSPVARQAHNLKVVGSNPTPATKISPLGQRSSGLSRVRGRPAWCVRSEWTAAGTSSCAHPRWPRFRCARVGAKPKSSFDHSGEPTHAPRSRNGSWHFWHWAAAPARKRERVCRTISTPIPSTSSTRDFHVTRPTCTFSATDFASFRRASTETATFAGTCRRTNGVGASCRAQRRWASPAESNGIPVARKIRKVLKSMRHRRKLIGRVDGGLSDRTTMVQGESQPPPHN